MEPASAAGVARGAYVTELEQLNARLAPSYGVEVGPNWVQTTAAKAALATFETSGGLFSQQASPGFIELFTLQSRLAHRIRKEQE